ncbi:MAG: hypothetical protein HRF46_06965 [Acidobacteriota bacterium]|jgi:Ser-tRNA(Ala) deacylase AlaX
MPAVAVAERLAWEVDPYRRELDAEVVASGGEPGKAWAILNDTVLYPEGGGQPSDRGWINNTPVLAVRRTPEAIIHELAAPVSPGPARVCLDWVRRFDHMQQHAAQHLLTALAQDRFGWPTTAFHLGERLSDIELNVPSLTPGELVALEEAAAAEIRAARPVHCRWVAPEEMPGLPIRTRGLPAGHRGEVRLVEIEGIDLNTCGGTHVACTAELESIVLLGTEPMRGGTRVFFAAGRRVRILAHEQAGVLARLRALLGAPDEELASVVEAKLETLRSAERLLRRWRDEAADALGEVLAASGESLAYRHLPDKELPFLQRAARRFVALSPARVVLLTGDSSDGGVFCLASGDAAEVDTAALASTFTGIAGGRCGGKGRFFQGKIPSFERREAAVEAVRSVLRHSPRPKALPER